MGEKGKQNQKKIKAEKSSVLLSQTKFIRDTGIQDRLRRSFKQGNITGRTDCQPDGKDAGLHNNNAGTAKPPESIQIPAAILSERHGKHTKAALPKNNVHRTTCTMEKSLLSSHQQHVTLHVGRQACRKTMFLPTKVTRLDLVKGHKHAF